MKSARSLAGIAYSMLTLSSSLVADVKLPAVIGDHMVLQRDMALPIWGWAAAGESVTVAIAGQKHNATAGDNGKWRVSLTPLADAPGSLSMTVTGKNQLTVSDILVGEVWLCSGQSNMQFAVGQSNDGDLETRAAHYPNIRMLTVDTPGTQESIEDFDGRWQRCSPTTVKDFSGVGYFFGRQLHQQLGVPIGLIDNAWGGSSCEAWVRRDLLQNNPMYEALLERWANTEKTYNHDQKLAEHRDAVAAWEKKRDTAVEAGKQAPRRPRAPRNPLTNQHRPANLYHGRLMPVMPFGIRGAIWYQGESNASRAYQYRDMFPRMIQNWRDDWKQGDFSFYWVQLADFRAEVEKPVESDWAELREAQTLTLDRLPNTGEAVITDLGEAKDIHPRNKQDVANRLARLALAKDYGMDIEHQSPRLKSAESKGNKMLVTLTGNATIRSVDAREISGFAIAGKDKQWHWAQAKITADQALEVWSDAVPKPVAVRYAWADNPVCNLYTMAGLPVTPFRSDEWPGKTFETR